MTVYVDPLFDSAGTRWCHMVADTLEELHAFAGRIGVGRRWFHKGHYDLSPGERLSAIAAGALESTTRMLS